MNSTVLAVVAIVLVLFVIVVYNRLVTLRNYVKEAFSTMDVYLKKRWDLIPNLIEIVKAYAGHEKSLLEDVAKLRSGNYSDMSDNDKIDTNKKLGESLSQIIAVVENYPDLKANEHYAKLMEELTSIENDIANSRKYYNGCVRILNNTAEIFPTSLIAGVFGIKSAKMFEITEGERQNIKTEF